MGTISLAVIDIASAAVGFFGASVLPKIFGGTKTTATAAEAGTVGDAQAFVVKVEEALAKIKAAL